jgi:hypothetical protein
VEHHADQPQAHQVLASLAALDEGEAWIWSPGWLGLFHRVRIRPRTTFDSSATPRVGEQRAMPVVIAQADLDVLRERMQATVLRAQADDPRELRRRIDQLQAQLRTTSTQAPVEVPVLRDHQVEQLHAATTSLAAIAAGLRTALARVQRTLPRTPLPPETPAAPPTLPRSLAPNPSPPFPAPGGPPEPSRKRRARRPAMADQYALPPLRGGERRMLDALVRHYPVKMTRTQLAQLAGLTSTGGTFGTYFATLERRGLVFEGAAGVELTSDGLARGGGPPSQPQTPAQLLEAWRRALPAGERRILDALIQAHPHDLTRDELGARADLQSTGGTFGSYLGTLRRNGLAQVEGDRVRIGEALASHL